MPTYTKNEKERDQNIHGMHGAAEAVPQTMSGPLSPLPAYYGACTLTYISPLSDYVRAPESTICILRGLYGQANSTGLDGASSETAESSIATLG